MMRVTHSRVTIDVFEMELCHVIIEKEMVVLIGWRISVPRNTRFTSALNYVALSIV